MQGILGNGKKHRLKQPMEDKLTCKSCMYCIEHQTNVAHSASVQ